MRLRMVIWLDAELSPLSSSLEAFTDAGDRLSCEVVSHEDQRSPNSVFNQLLDHAGYHLREQMSLWSDAL